MTATSILLTEENPVSADLQLNSAGRKKVMRKFEKAAKIWAEANAKT